MTNNMKSYPSIDNLEGKTVDELFALRQQLREVRDNQRIMIAEEITAKRSELRREGINERRIFDIQLNELKRQLEDIGDKMGPSHEGEGFRHPREDERTEIPVQYQA